MRRGNIGSLISRFDDATSVSASAVAIVARQQLRVSRIPALMFPFGVSAARESSFLILESRKDNKEIAIIICCLLRINHATASSSHHTYNKEILRSIYPLDT